MATIRAARSNGLKGIFRSHLLIKEICKTAYAKTRSLNDDVSQRQFFEFTLVSSSCHDAIPGLYSEIFSRAKM
ncbi:MAG: hypothetical protein CMO03_04825 [Thalassospira sp.]|uniref:Uncharacterized protein n=1 Tax=Thalassospira xiamenensis TaxID=220697 RepID=A0ABR5XZU6_9PROT|nr:hypothetical protein AUP40_19385 [Thalassospira xiamenensis]MAB33488.1 hypothetical protein [Thalassospira sp.]OHZ03542.1 hypothetical protein BC440_03175 [Thalassospira sp. MIT1004]KZD06312.1 hypothetical protein AUP45_19940 [Thalassospira xiamenensis]MAL28836.1 hypothetical protein [Thalassospira sp.]|tara:strand:- start:1378 stop:1596 length:219 start_codon:yes stop_codon:yes gene_type:complete